MLCDITVQMEARREVNQYFAAIHVNKTEVNANAVSKQYSVTVSMKQIKDIQIYFVTCYF